MSAHAGILYSDARPVPTELLEGLSRENLALGPHRTGAYIADGLAMLSYALQFDSLSRSECQPVYVRHDGVLTWDGRLDNRAEVLPRLQSVLNGDFSDAALMAHAINRWGEEALRTVTGDWSLAYWKQHARELLLARDYTGNRPLYYCYRPECFVWSTALDAIAAVCERSTQINDTYIVGLVSFNVPENQTCYRDIFAVPPGQCLRLTPGRPPLIRRFASFAPQAIRYGRTEDYHHHYRTLFTDAVRARLRSRTVVYSELSGGYDSSAITSVAHSLVRAGDVEAPRLQAVSSITPESPESDEQVYIAAVEQFCGLQSLRVRLRSRFDLTNNAKPQHLRDASRIPDDPTELAVQMASHTLLSGELGDVITMPYDAQTVLTDHARHARFRRLLADAFGAGRASRMTLADLFRSLVAAFLPARRELGTDRLAGMARLRGVSVEEEGAIFGLRRDALRRFPVPESSVHSMLDHMPRHSHRPVRALHSFIHAGILSGVRGHNPVNVSFPFAHKPLVDFILSVPPGELWSPNHPRAFICAALDGVLPRAIVLRRTKGYAAPAASRVLLPDIADAMSELRNWRLVQLGYAEPETLSSVLRALTDGSRSVSGIVLRIFNVEALLRRVLDYPAPSAPAIALTHSGVPTDLVSSATR